jgi:hypothetical protein
MIPFQAKNNAMVDGELAEDFPWHKNELSI